MKRTSFHLILSVASASLFLACGDAAPGADSPEAALAPAGGPAAIAAPGVKTPDVRWRPMGKGRVIEVADAEAAHAAASAEVVRTAGYAESAEEKAALAKADGKVRVRAFNPQTGDEFLVELPQGDLLDGAPEAGLLRLAKDQGDPPPIAGAWSNGVDNRTRMNDTGTNHAGRTTGYLSNVCSGALIGPRHILTAAHCVVEKGSQTNPNDNGSANWYNFTFYAGRNGAANTASGSATPVWYYTPDQYREPGHTQSYYNRFDYAIVVLSARLGDSVGWMGRVAIQGETITSKSLSNRGYPQCPSPNANHPAGCGSNGQQWADASGACSLGSSFNTEFGGWNANIYTHCDISGGHSGSPVYYWSNGLAITVGVIFWETCYTCGAGDQYPNIIRRNTPTTLTMISNALTSFP